MTVPGGVPNLPVGALTLDTLAARTQDMSGDAMKARAVERFPSIMGGSTGLDPALDITPFGILTRIWSEVNSLIATADPADIEGPEDLPPLVLEWIEGLPFVGELLDLLSAILGTYDGDDEVLLTVQEIFAPIRKLMQLFSGLGDGDGFPTLEELIDGFPAVIAEPAQQLIDLFLTALSGLPVVGGLFEDLQDEFDDLIGQVDDTTAQSDDDHGDLADLFDALGDGGGLAAVLNVIPNLFTTLGLGGSAGGLTGSTGGFNPISAGISFLDGLVPDLGFLRSGLFSGFTGHTGTTDVTEGAVTEATASTSEAVAGLGASFTQLAAALSNTGTPDADDFERSSVGAGWFVGTSSGTVSIPDGHNLHFSGTGSAEYVMRRIAANAVDRMTSTIVLNEAIPTYFFLPVPYGGFIDCWVRCTEFTTYATRSGVRLRVNSTGLGASWVLANVVSGTATTLASGSCKIPGKGGFPSLEAGAGGTPRRFVGTLSGAAIEGCDFTDTGLVTGFGPTYRWRGLGGRGNSGVGTAQGTPDLRQWGGG